MTAASTAWRGAVARDKASRFAGFAERFVQMQQRKWAKHVSGSALPRKLILALRGTLAVLPKLPAHARHSLFALPGTYAACVRLSNDGIDRAREDAYVAGEKTRGAL